MTKVTRHVGQDHLGNKLLVVFRELPEDSEHCLVVQSSTLPDMYHDNLMNVVESEEAQQTVDLYEVLNRRVFGDGQPMLTALHNRGLLKKMSVDHISLLPMPNRALPLRDANAAIRGESTTPPSDVVELPSVESPKSAPPAAQAKSETEQPSSQDQAKLEAEGLIEQARLLEEDAKKYRERAYKLVPELKKGGRPSKKRA